MQEEVQVAKQEKLIRLPDVIRLTGKKRSSIYDDIKRGLFPNRVMIGLRAVAWRLSEVEAWITEREGAKQ